MILDKERLHYLLTHSDWSADDCAWMDDCIQNKEAAVYEQLRLLLLEEKDAAGYLPQDLSERIKNSLLDYINNSNERNKASSRYLSGESAAFFERKLKEETVWELPSASGLNKEGKAADNGVYTEKGEQRYLLKKKVYWVAAILIVFIVSVFMTKYLKKDNRTFLNKTVALNKEDDFPLIDTILNASNGEQTVYLSDSTKVVLKPDSYIYFDRVFAQNKKIVHIKGEATFTVNNEAGRPFSVFAGNMEVRDLGTIFYVNNRDNHLSVKLIEGKVLLHAMETAKLHIKDIILKPGAWFKMNKITNKYQLVPPPAKPGKHKTIKEAASTEKLVKTLDFINAPLTDVLDNVADKYQLNIRYNKNGLEDKLFTGNLSRVDSVDKVLLLICIPNNLTYSKKADTVIIE